MAITIGANICEMDKTTFMVVQFILLFLYATWLQKIDDKEFVNKKNEITTGRFLLVVISRLTSIAALVLIVFFIFNTLQVSVVSIVFSLLAIILAGSTLKSLFIFVLGNNED